MKFNECKLDNEILDALEALGYKEALPVQEKVIPILLKEKDAVVKAKTGSGKTASFAIPIIQQLLWNERSCQALVLTPTRELALQIKEEFDHIGAFKRIKTLAVFGKQPFRFQAADLKQRTHVVVGTPGRVLDHLEQGTMDVSKLRYVILDEADEMLNMGFIDSVRSIFAHLPKERITCMFSATMPEEIRRLADDFLQDAKQVDLQDQIVTEQVEHYAYRMMEHEKLDFLVKLLCHEKPQSCIIFAKTQEHVRDICAYLHECHMDVDMLHGGMLQEDRLANMKDFKLGKLRILVATDVAARGIDIQDVTHIINYDMPNQKETYVHRIGRAGRVDATGTAISFLAQYDEERIACLEEYLGYALEVRERKGIDDVVITKEALADLGVPKHQKEEKGKQLRKDTMKLYLGGGKSKKIRAGDIVGAICEIDGVTGEDIGVIQVQDHQSYVDILHGKGNRVCAALQKKTIKGKKLKVQPAKS